MLHSIANSEHVIIRSIFTQSNGTFKLNLRLQVLTKHLVLKQICSVNLAKLLQNTLSKAQKLTPSHLSATQPPLNPVL